MLLRRAVLSFLLVAFASGCSASAPPALTIVHFNDVYEIGPVEGGRVGGLARVATVINDLRRTNAPVMTTLGGDFLSPSALATARVDGEPLAGRQMVDVLNAVGLEYATLGNHEFDLAEPAFHARLAQSEFKIITSNVTDLNGVPFPHTESFAVVPVRVGNRDLKIGLIGVVLDSNPKAWVRYLPVIDSARAAIAKMGAVDAIVALTHLSLQSDQELVTAIPEIDLSLGGHEHENWLVYRGPNLTPIVKADANVRSLAVISMTFPTGHRPQVSVRLAPITEAITADPAVEAEVTRWTTVAFDAFRADGFTPDRVIASLTTSLDGRESTVRNRSGNMTDLITAALNAEAGDVDVAIMNGGSIRIDDELPAGPVTEYDVIRVLPFGGNVVRLSMPGSLLARVLDVGVTNKGNGGFLHAHGVTRPGAQWMVQGKPLNPSVRYTVATTDFLMTGRETNLPFLTRDHPLVRDVEDLRDIRLAVMAEMAKQHPPAGATPPQ
ncbi:MAG: bifunctional metallophosphatase/5'-nucleotidase [Acidobacteria bacterium]|nr:bifunctional metallophosphatase/5'-nucleotidase [Acidobacteriota bacterium]